MTMSDGDHEGAAICIGICCVIPIVIILVFVFAGEQIMQGWQDRISSWMEEQGIEVPGFEPVLFLSVFGVLALLTILRYHLKHKRNQ